MAHCEPFLQMWSKNTVGFSVRDENVFNSLLETRAQTQVAVVANVQRKIACVPSPAAMSEVSLANSQCWAAVISSGKSFLVAASSSIWFFTMAST